MAKLGGRHLSSRERIKIVSSRGARGLYGLGRFAFKVGGAKLLSAEAAETVHVFSTSAKHTVLTLRTWQSRRASMHAELVAPLV